MKIKFDGKKTIIYLYRYVLDFDDIEKLNTQIKNIFLKLIKIYNIDFFGYSRVDIYENKKYGYILEIEKIHGNDFNLDIIDLKVIVHSDVPFYIKMDDYPLIRDIKFIFKDNRFFINIDDVDNILEYIEFGSIERTI